MAIIMGTAGHIDHGKTSLIKALTGIHCDRLEEEKKRGITIELGFAYFDFIKKNNEKVRMGIIDVPGHEKFVKNMVAGANGIDFVLLVIAADEGVMPQTREHLEICSLLNINDGIIVLTKKDMVDDDLLALAKEDVREFVQGSFLENAPIFAVSSFTGEGIEDLKKAIIEKNNTLIPKRRNNIFRLPVDRVFSLKGHGTLITGTLLSGSAKVGDDVCIMPQNIQTKIRSIQNHGENVEKALAGHRTSINLANIETNKIERGNIIAYPNTLIPSTRWLVKLHCLSSSPKAIRHKSEIHFHHGTKEVMAKLYLKDTENLAPNEECLCEVRFSEPLCSIFQDKCVMRSFSPLQTVAGASIINPLPNFPKLKQIDTELTQELLTLENAFLEKDTSKAILTQISFGNNQGISYNELMLLCNLDTKTLEKNLQELLAKKEIVLFDKENKIYLAKKYVTLYETIMLNKIKEYHEKEPLKQFMPKASLLSNFTQAKLGHFLLEQIYKKGLIQTSEDGLCLKDHTINLKSHEKDLKETLYEEFTKNPLNPPLVKELIENTKSSQKDILNVLTLLVQEKKLIKIIEGMYFLHTEIQNILNNILAFYKENETLTPSDFKNLSGGLTRKYSIPVLEYFDKEKITIRIGDGRKLRNTTLL